MIRSYHPNDLEELKRIHSLYFANEFDLPDFLDYVCAFVVEDEQGIITFGGIRDIAESVTVTNKNRNPSDRIKALYQILDASIFVAGKMGYDQLYAFSQNPKWAKRLMKNGFRPPQGQSLILDL
jgi:citrate lyase synthetase